jgi:hypothetical protein
MKISPFNAAQKILHLDGKPFDLSKRPYLKPIYNSPHKRKSTSLASKMSIYGTIIPGFKTLYVSPTSKQSRVFSTVRLKEFLESPFIKKNLIDNTCAQAVFFKNLKNRSQYFIEYAFLTPDRVRGISADWILIDEVQDINSEFIPVIEEAASHSRFKYFTYAGTPKTKENTIEYYWDFSTQRELAVKCTHCNFWNLDLGIKNIGKEGLICARSGCGRSIEKNNSEWVRAFPLGDNIPYEGFHLNQLITPWTDWKEILVKKKVYSAQRFSNEVLGIPYDSGLKPVTMADLVACCTDRPMADIGQRFSSPLAAGIDWSVTSDVSYTVLTIGEYMPYPNKFKIHYMKLYDESMKDPRAQVADITDICQKFNVAIIGADWGAGSVQNISLAETFANLCYG